MDTTIDKNRRGEGEKIDFMFGEYYAEWDYMGSDFL